MTDGIEAPQPSLPTPKPIERRSVERTELTTAGKIQATKDWLITQREKVEQGVMTQVEFDELIARSMVARDMLTERANEKRCATLLRLVTFLGTYNGQRMTVTPFQVSL